MNCVFGWARDRLFDKPVVEMLLANCTDAKTGKIIAVEKKPAKKLRPQPLNTVEAQKLISRKLHIAPARAMEVMEKLYNLGFISYPRTETNRYAPSIDLKGTVKKLENQQQYASHIN